MGCTTTQRTEQVLEAMDFYFGKRHCRTVTLNADDDTGSLSGQYFTLNAIDENYVEKKYYVLLSDGTAVDPAPVGMEKLQLTYVQDTSKEAIASSLKTLIEAASDNEATTSYFMVTLTGSSLEIENAILGEITAESYANASDFSGVVNGLGFGGKLGAVAQGGGSLSTEQSLEDILSDQTGDIILDQIIKGSSVSMDLTLLEMNTDRWKSLIGNAYGAVSGASVGYGTSKLYTSSFDYAGQLVGHPIRLPLTDRSADIVIWKTTPNMNSINFSGSEVQSAEMSFVALKDGSKPSAINLFARGDHSLI